MINYDVRVAYGLRQYSSGNKSNLDSVISQMIDVIINQADTIKDLNDRILYLENRK